MAVNYAQNYGMSYPWTQNYGNANQTFPQNQGNQNANQNQIMFGNQLQQNFGSIMTVLVQGEAGAIAYPVASGNTVMLMDFDSGKFWLKSNVNGIPQKLRAFSFTEEEHDQARPINVSDAVTRDEFDNLSKSVSILSNDVHKLISELGGTGE